MLKLENIYTETKHLDELFSQQYDLRSPEIIRKYNEEGAELVEQDTSKARSLGVHLLKRDLATVDGEFIRHDSAAIATSIMELISNDLKFRDKESTPQYLLIKSILDEELKREKKQNKVLKKQKAKNAKLAKKGIKRKSKFAHKYKNRITAIQTADSKKIENQRLFSEMERLNKDSDSDTGE